MIVKRERNRARKSSIKSAVKKVLDSLERGDDIASVKVLLREAEAKLARAQNKGTMHRNTVSRKVSRLAKKVAAEEKK